MSIHYILRNDSVKDVGTEPRGFMTPEILVSSIEANLEFYRMSVVRKDPVIVNLEIDSTYKLNNHIFSLETFPLCLNTEPLGKVNGLFFDGEVFDHLTTDAMGSDDEEDESDQEDDSVNYENVLNLFFGVTLKCDTLVDRH